jgi:hypothetical protein
MNPVPQEPVAFNTALVIFVQAVLLMVIGLGWWDLTTEQTALVMAVVTSAVLLAASWNARRNVTPFNKP